MIKSHQRFLNATMVILDLLVLCASFILAWVVRFEINVFSTKGLHIDIRTFLIPALGVIPVYLLVYYVLKLYDPQRNKRISNEIEGIVKANFIGLLIFLSILFVWKLIDYSRLGLIIFAFFNTAFSILIRTSIRFVLREAREKGYNTKHVLVIGAGDFAISFVEKISNHKYLGYNIIGYLDDEEKIGNEIRGIKVLGKVDDLSTIISKENLDEIIIAITLNEYQKLGNIIAVCESFGVKANIIPAYYKYIPAKPYIDQIDDLHLINIRYVPLDDSFNKFIKRISDILMALLGILLTSPMLLVTSIIIRVTSKGPIFFGQIRVGLNRKEFTMYKFRSMKVQTYTEEFNKWTTKDDPRKTKIGEFIRKTSIDELPQLFNVLKGDMSMIGPRPE